MNSIDTISIDKIKNIIIHELDQHKINSRTNVLAMYCLDSFDFDAFVEVVVDKIKEL